MKKLSKKKVKARRKVGIAKAYMSRAVALRKLQLPLSDFRRLCILKGVYPVEPKNKSKLGGANTKRKTYFYTRDIQFLTHEPILLKFFEFKTFMKRLTKAKGRHDLEKFQKTIENKPSYKLDHVIKERYPRFVDALRDCDDALSMCFLFAMFPKARNKPDELIDMSRKLTLEFMHYIIHTRSLRKVFISIKGYYYQAEILGQTITWIVPHQFVIDRTSNVDINVMKTFTEFYINLLGFINYRLFKSINASYPPKILPSSLASNSTDKIIEETPNINYSGKRKHSERDNDEEDNIDFKDLLIGSLNKSIKILENKTVIEAESKDQQLDVFEDCDEESKRKPAEKLNPQQILVLENLFKGLKFFLSRETPRESLTFVIRSLGGEVSWDSQLFPGATYDESNSNITHQIADRPILKDQYVNRIYIQPQWVYDCVNMRFLIPTTEYTIGSKLPPHLSPFVEEKKGEYVPPDKTKLLNLRKQFEAENEREKSGVGDSELDPDTDMEEAVNVETDEESVRSTKKQADGKNVHFSIQTTNRKSKNERNRKRHEREKGKSNARTKMGVKTGRIKFEDQDKLKQQEDSEYRKMGILMIPKKKKRLFDRITKTRKEKSKKVETLRAKRQIVDAIKSRRHNKH